MTRIINRKKYPDRDPEVQEVLTDSQLTEAVGQWLNSKDRMPEGDYEASHLQVRPDGTHVFSAWRTQ